jgi:hypothetical protein
LSKKKQTRYIPVAIPCKRYLAKFAASVYGMSIRADSSTMFGFFLAQCLDKNRYESRANYKGKYSEEAMLKIEISQFTFNNIGFEISPGKVLAINTFLEKIFTEHLYQWCIISTKRNIRFKGLDEQIRSFAQHHGIILDDDNEDISFDALKKKEYRFRMNIIRNHNEYRKLFSANLSPRKVAPKKEPFCVLSGSDTVADFASNSKSCYVLPNKQPTSCANERL